MGCRYDISLYYEKIFCISVKTSKLSRGFEMSDGLVASGRPFIRGQEKIPTHTSCTLYKWATRSLSPFSSSSFFLLFLFFIGKFKLNRSGFSMDLTFHDMNPCHTKESLVFNSDGADTKSPLVVETRRRCASNSLGHSCKKSDMAPVWYLYRNIAFFYRYFVPNFTLVVVWGQRDSSKNNCV